MFFWSYNHKQLPLTHVDIECSPLIRRAINGLDRNSYFIEHLWKTALVSEFHVLNLSIMHLKYLKLLSQPCPFTSSVVRVFA